jgi:hypothetical protein|tara:strand:+ start:4225 stop:4683 length:459 start_codon:yes stop_codon:yes gene_type:complete
MLTIIGSLIGFAGSTIPSIMDFFNKKQDAKLELDMLAMKIEMQKHAGASELKMFEKTQYSEEHQRLIDHDIALTKDVGWVGALRKSVRPIITYCFFGLFVTVKVTFLIHVMEDPNMDFNEAIQLVWDSETAAIFASVLSFWFGSRSLDKLRR